MNSALNSDLFKLIDNRNQEGKNFLNDTNSTIHAPFQPSYDVLLKSETKIKTYKQSFSTNDRGEEKWKREGEEIVNVYGKVYWVDLKNEQSVMSLLNRLAQRQDVFMKSKIAIAILVLERAAENSAILRRQLDKYCQRYQQVMARQLFN